MIDAKDKKTVDLLPAPKKRGRPATGHAKSAAERKREQRQRYQDRFTEVDVTTLPLEAIYRRISGYVAEGWDEFLPELFDEIARRAKLNYEGRKQRQSSQDEADSVAVAVSKTMSGPVDLWPNVVTVAKKKNVRYALGENTWSGNGKRPQWVADAIARGMTLMDLLIK